ncbi:hypothetical protein CASFOL_010124 [Castilleja foliolosa]|uniref:C2H2-type domain-containing protein n=1 Tax=Castilleja foliolosa TaxID=1961234 RepID=A0ABD3DVD6_9LAMI
MEKLKWVCDQSFEKDRAYGFSWPQRDYVCSFCKKEFKSAQALGGHMNVHRRDRARLRLSSPWPETLNPNPNPKPKPNPNPNPNPKPNNPKPSFLFSTLSSPRPKILPRYNVSCHSSSLSFGDVNKSASLLEKNVSKKNKEEVMMSELARVWKANEFVRLDLNLGLMQDGKDEDLDLELKLGY